MQKSTTSDWPRSPGPETPSQPVSSQTNLSQIDLLDLRRIVRILIRERWLIATPVIIALLAVMLYVFLSPVRYTAVAQILVGSEQPNVISGDPRGADINRYMVGPIIDSEVEIIQSNRIAHRAIRQFDLMADLEAADSASPGLISSIKSLFSSPEEPTGTIADERMAAAIATLHQGLDVRRKGLTLIILVEYTHADPKIAAKIANAIVRAYLAEQLDSKARVTKKIGEKLRLRVAELRKELFAAELRLQEYREKSVAKNDVNLLELERQVKVTTDLYVSLLAKLSETEAAKGLIYADAHIVESATVPAASGQSKLIPLGLGLMGGLGIGVALALVKDHLSTVIRHVDDINQRLGIPLLGTTPLLPEENDKILREVLVNRSSAFSQAIFSMKHALLGKGEHVPPQLVAVVSARSGEGKTVIAANFAQYAAASGMKTLLIDCDLRDPQLTAHLAPTLKKSFIDVAKREAEIGDALVQDAESGLFFCPGQRGELPGNPMEILASQEMSTFLSSCRQLFDLIVLDTSALLPNVDARALVESVDAAMLVVECGRTTADDAREALWSESTLIGKACAVLNKAA